MSGREPSASALIVAHPGHELRVHGWLEREHPVVFVLTDGSGSAGAPRTASTAEVLRRAGARPGPVFGRFSDRDLYELILDRRTADLELLVHELAAALAGSGVERVVGDAAEGYNPSHDLCRMLADAAVAEARRRTGRAIESYAFLLEGRPDDGPPGALRLDLDAGELARKLAAARAYPEMAAEVERAFAQHGVEPFRVESLRPVDPEVDIERQIADPPFYERYGERQVAAGRYRRVLRFREHFLPVARALRELGRRP